MFILWPIVYGCFYTAMADLSSYNRDPLRRLKYLVPAPTIIKGSIYCLLVLERLATFNTLNLSLKELKMIKVFDFPRKEILSMLWKTNYICSN